MSPTQTPMSSVDHAWLRMETPQNHMMIGIVLIFKAPLMLAALKGVIQPRLIEPYKRFSQKAVDFGSHAVWEDDPGFNLDNHINACTDVLASKADLQGRAGALMSQPLDKGRPLWDMVLFERYQQASALVIRIHHAVADGMSLVRLMISITDHDGTADDRLCSDKPTAGAASRPVVHHTEHGFLHPVELLKTAAIGVKSVAELARVTFTFSDPEVGLKGALSGVKQVSWADPLPLSEAKDLCHRLKVTLNDLLMSAAAGALRTYLLRHQQAVDGVTIHVAVPFNLRSPDAPVEQLGNEFGLVIVPLPIGIEDPLDRLQKVRQDMQQLKHSLQPYVFYGLIDLLGKGPSLFEKTALEILSKKASAVMTNVPGPRSSLSLAGVEIDQPQVWVPQSGDIGIGLSILSYNQRIHFGFIADQALIDKVDEVTELFIAQFRILEMLITGQLRNET